MYARLFCSDMLAAIKIYPLRFCNCVRKSFLRFTRAALYALQGITIRKKIYIFHFH